MSSRKDEKERLRAEREAAETKAQAATARRQRFVLAGIGVAAIAVVVVLVLVATGGGGDGGGNEPTSASTTSVKLPARAITDLTAAAKAAGCVLRTPPSEGRGHTTTKVVYKTNPPTSGAHYPEAAQDGVYEAGNPPAIGNSVHALEHGRIDIQYSTRAPTSVRDQLEAVFNERLGQLDPGYHMLLFENQTGMKDEVAATAWTQSLTCATFTPEAIDALRAFRERYIDKGPEFIP